MIHHLLAHARYMPIAFNSLIIISQLNKGDWFMIIINPLPHGVTRALLISFFAWSALHPAVFTVINTADSGAGSLRQAITNVNASVDATNTINFNIPGTGPFTIAPATDLPNISKNVTINGYSQPGSSVNTLAQGDNAVLQIIINGSNYTVGNGKFTGNGLHFAPTANGGVDGSIVRGLIINEWLLNGILLDATGGTISGVQINGNFIGTNAAGTAVDANRCGIGISTGNPRVSTTTITGTIIGTPAFADRNIIAGSFGYMIFDGYNVRGACITTSSATGTLIQNNYIGTNINGTTALGNSQCGVLFEIETTSTIGGTAANQRNIISGHSIYGVNLTSLLPLTLTQTPGCVGCLVQGNYIGTDVSGTATLGNSNAGIALDSFSTGNIIGGLVAGAGNLISGNGNGLIPGSGVGIRLGQFQMPGSTGNVIQGNLIGTDVSGTRALANVGFGIVMNDQQNTIGGSTALARNIISGNTKGGVFIYGTNSDVVTGNYIGTDYTGTKSIPNGGNGIQLGANGTIACAATNNTIGQ